jgi:hypothetical protein
LMSRKDFRQVVAGVLVWLAAISPNAALADARSEACQHYYKAVDLDHAGRTTAAIDELKEAIRLCPDYKMAYISLGNLWHQLNRPREAWAAYNAGRKRFPDNSDFWAYVGREYIQCGDDNNALLTFRQALTKFPERKSLHREIAVILLTQKKFSEALKEMQVAPTEKMDWTYWMQLGDMYVGSGDLQNGVNAYQQGYNLVPNRSDILEVIQRMKKEIQDKKLAAAPRKKTTVQEHLSARDGESFPDKTSMSFEMSDQSELLINAQVGSKTAQMILDPSRGSSSMSPKQLEELGGTLTESSQPVSEGGKSKKKLLVKIGDLARMVDFDLIESSSKPLLGGDFLSQYKCQVDRSAGFVRLEKYGKTSMSSPLSSKEVSFTRSGTTVILSLQINGRELPAELGNNDTTTTLTRSGLARASLAVPGNAELVSNPAGKGAAIWYRFKIPSLRMGPIDRTNFPVTYIDEGPYYCRLGKDFFAGRSFSIDENRSVLRFD